MAKLFTADVWVVLDDVQFTRRDYQHRCRLADTGSIASEQWLTLPVRLPRGRATAISDVRILDAAKTRLRVARLIQQYYGRSPHWPLVQDRLQELLDAFDHTDRLTVIILLELLGWPGTIARSSEMSARGGRSVRLAALTCAVGATSYLYGTGGARYLDPWPFATHGLHTELFTTPNGSNARVWHAARRITALKALTAVGPDALNAMLTEHATVWRMRRRAVTRIPPTRRATSPG